MDQHADPLGNILRDFRDVMNCHVDLIAGQAVKYGRLMECYQQYESGGTLKMWSQLSLREIHKYFPTKNRDHSDVGVDLVGLDGGELHLVQCKRYSGTSRITNLDSFFMMCDDAKSAGFKIRPRLVVTHMSHISGRVMEELMERNVLISEVSNEMIRSFYELAKEALGINEPANGIKNHEMPTLRPHQVEAKKKIMLRYQEALSSKKQSHIKIKMACGTGKSLLMADCIRDFIAAGERCLVMVPYITLGEQLSATFDKMGIKHSRVWTGMSVFESTGTSRHGAIICVYNSIAKIMALPDGNKIDHIFIDEAHHLHPGFEHDTKDVLTNINDIMDNGHISIINDFSKLSRLTRIDLSATINDAGCDYVYDFGSAINDGVLCNYRVEDVITDPSLTSPLPANQSPRDTTLVSILNEHQEFRKTIVLCDSIEKSVHLRKLLTGNGILAEAVNSNVSSVNRERIFNEFRDGPLRVIVAINILNEGVDLPITDSVIFYEGRHVPIKIIQGVGRSLRLHPLKTSSTIITINLSSPEAGREITKEYKKNMVGEVVDAMKDTCPDKGPCVTSRYTCSLMRGGKVMDYIRNAALRKKWEFKSIIEKQFKVSLYGNKYDEIARSVIADVKINSSRLVMKKAQKWLKEFPPNVIPTLVKCLEENPPGGKRVGARIRIMAYIIRLFEERGKMNLGKMFGDLLEKSEKLMILYAFGEPIICNINNPRPRIRLSRVKYIQTQPDGPAAKIFLDVAAEIVQRVIDVFHENGLVIPKAIEITELLSIVGMPPESLRSDRIMDYVATSFPVEIFGSGLGYLPDK